MLWQPVYDEHPFIIKAWSEAGEKRTETRRGPKASQACSWVSKENHLREAHTEMLGGGFCLHLCDWGFCPVLRTKN